MSPRTVPCRVRSVTSTGPSMEPVPLTDKEAGVCGSARTPPVTVPSRCSPPANSTSPWTFTDFAISVSMRRGLESFLNMGWAPAGALRRHDRAPRERLRERGDILAGGADLDRQVLRAEALRDSDGLFEVLVVPEIVGHAGVGAARQGLGVEHRHLAFRVLPVNGQAHGPGSHAIGLAGSHEGDMDQEVAGRLAGGQAYGADADADGRRALGNHRPVER